MANDVIGKLPAFLATTPADHSVRRLPLAVVLLSLLIFVAAVPFAHVPLPQVWAFIPIYQSALVLNDVITAGLLFTQFTIVRSRALLVLACGYLFTAVIAVLHLLTFPGLFSPTGLLGAGPQSTAWLYMFWHGVFPLAVIAYALLKDRNAETRQLPGSSNLAFVLFSLVAVLGLACALTLIATTGQALLPAIMRGNNYTPVMIVVVSTVWMLSLVALLVLLMRRPHTMLDMWLMAVMCAWLLDVALSAVFNGGRFDLGFYAGRICGLLAATFVLLGMMLEMSGLYARLARSLETEQEERKHEMEERRRVFETSLDLILVTDYNGNLIRVSPSSAVILGYLPEEMIGCNAAEFVYPEDLEVVRAEMRLVRRGKLMRNFEIRYVARDGYVVTLAWSGVWSEPEQRHFFIGRDMTEKKMAEEKFRLAVEASPSGLVMINGNGTIVLINAETERLFGYERKELIGQSIEILVPAGARHRHPQHRAAFVDRPEARRMGRGRDLSGLRKDGSEFPIEIGLNPIQTQEGAFVLSVIVDISERKRAEAELREYAAREQLFIAAVESSDDAIVTKTLDGKITGWNQAAERLFGYTAREAISKEIDLIVPDDCRDEVRGILDKLRRGEKISHHETVRVNKVGRRIDVSLSVSPVKLASGEIIGAAKIVRDITESNRARRALADSERMALAIIETALDAFLQLDESGIILDWNRQAEAMFGRSRQEAVGQALATLLIPADIRTEFAQRLAQFVSATDSGVPSQRYETRALRQDGTEFKVELSMTALRRDGGHVYNAFIRDLTEKIAIEEQFRQAQKMEAVGQLTGGIAHDFNNMLTVITGTIEILAEAVANKPQLAAVAKLISEAADRGTELTGRLLAFARKQPLQPRETDVNALIIDAVRLFTPSLGAHIEIESMLEATPWPALVDPTQLTSALLNLALNARDAMPDGGKLLLETKNIALDGNSIKASREVQPGNYVMVAMSDTGAGIPEAIRAKVFEPFFSTKGVGKGTGLGLSMVYGFVKQSGGHIEIDSEDGCGTTIRIYLPQAAAHDALTVEAIPGPRFEGGTETILVVEDDPLVSASVNAQLKGLGYTTLSAATGAEALELAGSGVQFDLLFTDVVMPGGMNGRQLAEEMAKRHSPIKVLFTSGFTENAIDHHGRLDPGVLLLAKPYRKSELARMIRLALDVKSGSEAIAVPKARAS